MTCKLSKFASASDNGTCDCSVADVVGRSDSAKSAAPSTNGEIETIMHKKSILKMSNFIKPPGSCMHLILLRRILKSVGGESGVVAPRPSAEIESKRAKRLEFFIREAT